MVPLDEEEMEEQDESPETESEEDFYEGENRFREEEEETKSVPIQEPEPKEPPETKNITVIVNGQAVILKIKTVIFLWIFWIFIHLIQAKREEAVLI